MISDWIGDLLGELLGGVIGDELTERRAERATRKQLAAFSAGRPVTIRCAFHEQAGWRHGRLELVKGRAAWTRRFAKEPGLVLARGEATPLHSRPVTRAEAPHLSPRLTVLVYQRGEATLECAVRVRDLAVIARVLELPGRGPIPGARRR